MRVNVDQNACIGCGLCVGMAPDEITKKREK